jgi:hypothetical protein
MKRHMLVAMLATGMLMTAAPAFAQEPVTSEIITGSGDLTFEMPALSMDDAPDPVLGTVAAEEDIDSMTGQ